MTLANQAQPQADKRDAFLHLNKFSDDIGLAQANDKKMEVLTTFSEALTDLDLLAYTLKNLSEQKERLKKPDLSPEEKKVIDYTIADSKMSVPQLLWSLGNKLPDSAYQKIGQNPHIVELGNDDLIALMHEKFHDKDTSDLIEAAKRITTKEGYETLNTASTLKLATEYLDSNTNPLAKIDKYITTKNEIGQLRKQGKEEDASKLIDTRILSNLDSDTTANYERLRRAVNILPSREILSEVKFKFSTHSTVVNPEYNEVFSICGNGTINNPNLDPKKLANIERLRHLMWDHQIPWTTSSQGESDVRFIETAYATHKRHGHLFSSLKNALLEADKLSPELRAEHRKKHLEQFWKLFAETSLHINLEFKNALEATEPALFQAPSEKLDSIVSDILRPRPATESVERGELLLQKTVRYLIQEGKIQVSNGLRQDIESGLDTSLITRPVSSFNKQKLIQLAQPYEDLSNAIYSLTPSSMETLYSSDALKSSAEIFNITLPLSSDASDLVANGLKNINASPNKVLDILDKFTSLNKNHPEKEKMDQWAEQFRRRYAEFGIRR